MKKLIAGILLAAIICLNPARYSLAAGGTVESPDITVFVCGRNVEFNSSPITVDGQILLGGRELLAKLGVPNDNRHVQITADKKRLVINSGKKQIEMKVGSTRAVVGKSSSLLNTAPVLFNGTLYIPVKSTAQLLNMKFAADDGRKSVYIQTLNGYNRVRAVIDKAVAASAAADRYKVEYSLETTEQYRDYPVVNRAAAVGLVDRKKMIMAVNSDMHGSSLYTRTGEYYLHDNCLYTRNAPEDKWDRELLSEQDYKAYIMNFDISRFEVSEVLYCGLILEENKKDDTILLSGNVFLRIKQGGNQFEPADAFLEIGISKNHLISNITRTHSEFRESSYFDRYLVSSSETFSYGDYNGDFIIKTPEADLNGS